MWEKVPFICLIIPLSIVTFWAQDKDKMVISTDILPFIESFINAIVSYVAYLGKIFWPVNLAVFYPFEYSMPLWKVLISAIILIAITLVVLYYIKKLPFLFVGWFWYLGTLVPVIGLVKAGTQAIADRYTYLPSIGITMMLLWGIPLLFPREGTRKKIIFPAGVVFLTILAVLTWQQCGYWKNGIELFSHALQITKNNAMVHNNRGITYEKLGQHQLAINDYNEAIILEPDYAIAYYNRGCAYDNLRQPQRAVKDYNEAIRLKPDYAKAYYNRGTIYGKYGKHQNAIFDFNQAISLKPNDADAYNNRGMVYLNQGNNELGCVDAQKACAMGICNALEMAKGKGLCR